MTNEEKDRRYEKMAQALRKLRREMQDGSVQR